MKPDNRPAEEVLRAPAEQPLADGRMPPFEQVLHAVRETVERFKNGGIRKILLLNDWLDQHCPTCSACQELAKKCADGHVEVCREYSEQHRAMLPLVEELSDHDLEALARITRRDSFKKYQTGLARWVRFWRGDEMALCFTCGNLVAAFRGKCRSCNSDEVVLVSGKLDDIVQFASKVQESENDRAFLRDAGIKP